MQREKLAHLGINVVRCDGAPALSIEPGVDSRSRTEVEQRSTRRCDSQYQILKCRARAPVRFQRGNLLDVLRAADDPTSGTVGHLRHCFRVTMRK